MTGFTRNVGREAVEVKIIYFSRKEKYLLFMEFQLQDDGRT